MKIAILGENKSTHLQKWVKALAEKNDLEIFVFSNSKGVELPKVKYFYFKQYTTSKLNYLLNIFFVAKKLRQIKPNILHAHFASSYAVIGAFCFYQPFIITGWGADIFDVPNGNWIIKQLIKFAFRKAKKISILTKITQKELVKLTPKPATLIPFGVDLNIFKFQSKKINDGIFRIGTARTMEEKYGLTYLIEAFAIVHEKYANTRLELIGDGFLRKQLEKKVVDLHLKSSVAFHGYINQIAEKEKYLSIMHSLDVFTITSILDSETFGVAAVEASAIGLPVVASNIGGLPEVIDNGKTGMLIPPKNAAALANAIIYLIENEAIKNEMGIAGRKKVEQEFDWNKNVEQMILLYKSVVKDSK